MIIVDVIAPPPGTTATVRHRPHYLRITYIHNDINSGACAVRNQAIMLRKGRHHRD
ncbi:hypothetical protein ACLK1T_23830 [Escherichia coli]